MIALFAQDSKWDDDGDDIFNVIFASRGASDVLPAIRAAIQGRGRIASEPTTATSSSVGIAGYLKYMCIMGCVIVLYNYIIVKLMIMAVIN